MSSGNQLSIVGTALPSVSKVPLNFKSAAARAPRTPSIQQKALPSEPIDTTTVKGNIISFSSMQVMDGGAIRWHFTTSVKDAAGRSSPIKEILINLKQDDSFMLHFENGHNQRVAIRPALTFEKKTFLVADVALANKYKKHFFVHALPVGNNAAEASVKVQRAVNDKKEVALWHAVNKGSSFPDIGWHADNDKKHAGEKSQEAKQNRVAATSGASPTTVKRSAEANRPAPLAWSAS